MKKIFAVLFFISIAFSLSAQETETITALQKKIDSLEQRLDEKNYTRVPNAAIDEELNKKVEELNKSIERFKTESADNMLRLKQEIYGDIERITQEKFRDLDKSNKEIQAEMNEALDQLFAQTVESITEAAQRKGKAVDPKA